MLTFAACMRAHGVHAFPDPVLGHGHIQFEPDPHHPIDWHAPAVTAAFAACRGKLSSTWITKLFGGLAQPGKSPGPTG
jgi:hypothetical protein